nr:MAG TPA: hypothetical protein [Caudoviricetes sp.]
MLLTSCSLVDFQDHRRHIQKHLPSILYIELKNNGRYF